jgi:hypothetical protein
MSQNLLELAYKIRRMSTDRKYKFAMKWQGPADFRGLMELPGGCNAQDDRCLCVCTGFSGQNRSPRIVDAAIPEARRSQFLNSGYWYPLRRRRLRGGRSLSTTLWQTTCSFGSAVVGTDWNADKSRRYLMTGNVSSGRSRRGLHFNEI